MAVTIDNDELRVVEGPPLWQGQVSSSNDGDALLLQVGKPEIKYIINYICV